MPTPEQEFTRRLGALDRDGRACCVYLYTELAFHNITGNDAELRERVNEHATFWNTALAGLQTAAFIALGKIYDSDPRTDSASQLLRFADDHLGIFSRVSLKARKLGFISANEIDAYVAATFEPRPGAFKALRAAVDEHRALYVAKVEPIRHRVFAHAARISREERDELFSGLFVREIERLAVFPIRLESALFNLYHNGYEPTLKDDVPTVITDVLAAAPGPHVSTWEHLDAAASVVRFLKTQ